MKIRNIILTVVMIAAMTLSFAGCGSKGGDEAPEVKIDYGTSELYSQEDMDSAIEKIEKEFAGWEGCELHSIVYAGDECQNEENIKWLNELAEANGYDTPIVQVIEFKSTFHSPVDGGGSWEADKEYEDWSWFLGKTDGGDWKLISWGY